MIVTCKGRLPHLRVTLPLMVAEAPELLCLVDAGCPQGAGEWAEHWFQRQRPSAELLVVRCGATTEPFHKAAANNAGARAAAARGAQRFLFLDADTVVRGALGAALALVRPVVFCIVGRGARGQSLRSLTGVLGVTAQDFFGVGGYDEEFRCWGGEDVDLRLRLHLLGGSRYEELDSGAFGALPHGNALRVRYYAEKNIVRGARHNDARIADWVLRKTGKNLRDQGPLVSRLLFGGP